MATGSRIERKKYEQQHKGTARRRQHHPQKGSKKIIKQIIIWAITLLTFALIAGAALFGYYAMNAPEITENELIGTIPTKIYDRDGELIKELGSKNRDLLTADEIPTNLKNAVLAIEDSRFYSHNGIDPIRIVGALLANIKSGGISQGGSTITQQLIKLSVFSTDFKDQTLERKAQEAWLALQIEQEYTKDELLTFYLNKLFYSNNVYGAKTAAKSFFGKALADLNIAEAALLAGIPQAPSQLDPYTYPEAAKKRRDTVLQVMYQREMISQAEYDEAYNTPIEQMLQPLSTDTISEVDMIIDSYLTVVAEEVKEKTNLDIYTDGIEVYTNLDMDAQRHIYETVNQNPNISFPNDQMQAAVSVIDVTNGELLAIIGGRKQEAPYGFNRASASNRSIGSTMKPLADYGPAIEYLNYSTGQKVIDEPLRYSSGDEIRNYDFNYKGDMTIREALVGSRNIPALKMLKEVGLDNAYAFLQKLGISIKNDNQNMLVESNAIGGEVSPIQLSAAYAAISNYGVYNKPFTVNKIISSAGTITEYSNQPSQAMKDSTAYMLVDMLKGVPNDFAPAVKIEGLHQAGKTGTTNYTEAQLQQLGLSGNTSVSPDAWYAGITPQYAIATWVGYDNPLEAGHYLEGNQTQLPQLIYKDVITYLMKDTPNTDWKQPASVVKATIEKYTDPIKLVGDYTPSDMTSEELFIKGTEPKEKSENYGKFINPPTYFDADYNQESKTISANWSGMLQEGAQYQLSINGVVVYTGTDTSFTLPAEELIDYHLVLIIVQGNNISDGLYVTLSLSPDESNSLETTSNEEEVINSTSIQDSTIETTTETYE